MGPSINLVSRQPMKPLELHFDVNTLWHSNLNIGGRWGKWFAQVDLGYSNVGNFRLPHSYPTTSSYLDGHKRLNSKSRDFNLNAKVGYVPNATDEYVVGYTLVRAEKHIPPYLGENGKAQFRIYPDWDKDEPLFPFHHACGTQADAEEPPVVRHVQEHTRLLRRLHLFHAEG